jgi:hypothetical protein
MPNRCRSMLLAVIVLGAAVSNTITWPKEPPRRSLRALLVCAFARHIATRSRSRCSSICLGFSAAGDCRSHASIVFLPPGPGFNRPSSGLRC